MEAQMQTTNIQPSAVELSTPAATPTNYEGGGETFASSFLNTDKFNWVVTIVLTIAAAYSIAYHRTLLSKL